MKDIEKISITHRRPEKPRDWLALYSVRFFRKMFDLLTGYNDTRNDTRLWINRVIFLETIAGVPGMVGGMTTHLKSLSTLKPDRGIIHHLLEESENERTHLFIFLNFKNPNFLFKAWIAASQAIFWNFYFICYFFNPKFCHRFVGYLEEEAVHTYSMFLKQLDLGYLPELQNRKAPQMARDYYDLPESATFRDMILAIRADESIHRETNHYFADLGPQDEVENFDIHILDRESDKN